MFGTLYGASAPISCMFFGYVESSCSFLALIASLSSVAKRFART